MQSAPRGISYLPAQSRVEDERLDGAAVYVLVVNARTLAEVQLIRALLL
jgi:hypothetical protein